MPIKFNVRAYASNVTTPDVYIQRSFDQINLMVYLFDGLDFRTIFGAKIADLVSGLRVKVGEAVKDCLLRKLEGTRIDAAAAEIVQELSAGHDLSDKTVKDFFIEDYSKYTDVFALFRQIEEAGVDLPFLHQDAKQKAGAKVLFDINVNPAVIGFLNDDTDPVLPGVGNLSEYDLYTRQYMTYYQSVVKRNVCKVIKMAKEAGVLRGQAPGGSVKAVSGSKLNDMACKDNVCMACKGYYCVMVGDPPGCSLDSDPWPEE